MISRCYINYVFEICKLFSKCGLVGMCLISVALTALFAIGVKAGFCSGGFLSRGFDETDFPAFS